MNYKDIKFRIELKGRNDKRKETLFVPLFDEKNGLLQYPIDLNEWEILSINSWDSIEHNSRLLGVGDSYYLGEIKTIHRIGEEYTIVEYYPHKVKNSHITEEIDRTRTMFHTFIKTKDKVRHQYLYGSFDEALIGAVAEKYEGDNTKAGYYICKMLGIKFEG